MLDSTLVVIRRIDQSNTTHGADALFKGACLTVVCLRLVDTLTTDTTLAKGLRVRVVASLGGGE